MGTYLEICCPQQEKEEIGGITASELRESFSKMYDEKTLKNSMNNKSKTIESLLFFQDSVLIGKGSGNPIDKYNIEELIGKGDNGSLVYKATLKSNGEKRAFKVIQKNEKSLNKTQELLKEIDLLEETDNPYIVKLYEFYDSPKYICLVNEYVKGGNLYDRLLKEKKFNELQTAIIIFQILSALSFCHSNKIIHRNLTMQNILIEDSKDNFIHIKIIDFSSSSKMIKGVDMGDSFGNLKYTAPEVLEGKYTETRDIWSVGIIMYTLLTGIFPFENKDLLKLKALIEIGNIDYDVQPLNKLSKDCINFLKELLNRNKNRISAQKALEHNWFKKLNIKEKLTFVPYDKIEKIINNIFNYKPKKTLQKLCFSYLTRNLKNEEIETATNLFCQIDIDNDGKVQQKEFVKNFKEIIEKTGKEIDEKYLKDLFNHIDYDRSGNIDYSEFITAAIDKNLIVNDKNLKESFEFFDKNKSGLITLSDLQIVFKKFKGFSAEEFNNIIKEVDKDGDDEITFEEYKDMMKAITNE